MKLSNMCHLNAYLWHIVIYLLSVTDDISLGWMDDEIIFYYGSKLLNIK